MPKTILEWLDLISGGAASAGLLKFLDRSASAHPDLLPKVNEIKAMFAQEVSAQNIADVAEHVKVALEHIAHADFEPTDPPADAI